MPILIFCKMTYQNALAQFLQWNAHKRTEGVQVLCFEIGQRLDESEFS